MRNKLVAAALACLMAVAVSGCGGGSDSASDDESPDAKYQPTAKASEDVELMDAPADFNEVQGAGFTISAPGEFQRKQKKSSNGEPMLILENRSQEPSVPQRVAVLRDNEPRSSATEQSYVLESSKGGAKKDVSRVEIEAPDGQSAYLVTWEEPVGGKGGDAVDTTYWQLMYQASDELILNVVALAPSAEFESSEVSRILRTFVADDTGQA